MPSSASVREAPIPNGGNYTRFEGEGGTWTLYGAYGDKSEAEEAAKKSSGKVYSSPEWMRRQDPQTARYLVYQPWWKAKVRPKA